MWYNYFNDPIRNLRYFVAHMSHLKPNFITNNDIKNNPISNGTRAFVFILLFVSLFGFFGVANAQFGTLPQTDVGIDMVPPNPGPGEVVYVSATSYGTDLNSANFTWMINGKTQKFGVGEKSFSFTTGDINTTTVLDISIETRSGEIIRKNFRVRPVSIDLIWESEGFVPPFYKGKALFSHQNKVTVIAQPHIISSNGQEIGAKNLIYTWKKNGSVIESASGFGKNIYSFVSPLISRPSKIEVEVSTVDDTRKGYSSITLNPTEPSILFYKKDPVNGIEFQKSLQNTAELLNSKEVTVVSVPLFFGTETPNDGSLSFRWFINGSLVKDTPNQSVQVFRPIEGTSGTAKISLSIENNRKILQSASNNFNLNFGNSND